MSTFTTPPRVNAPHATERRLAAFKDTAHTGFMPPEYCYAPVQVDKPCRPRPATPDDDCQQPRPKKHSATTGFAHPERCFAPARERKPAEKYSATTGFAHPERCFAPARERKPAASITFTRE